MNLTRLGILVIALASFCSYADNHPAWSLEAVGTGATLTESDLQEGNVTVLVFWATWCPYCKALLPHIQSIADEYEGRLEVAALNFRDDGNPEGYFAERGYTISLFTKADEVAGFYGIRGTPGVLVFDPAGKVVFNLYDYMPVAKERLKSEGEDLANWQKAARLTPLWAAELRRRLDATLADL